MSSQEKEERKKKYRQSDEIKPSFKSMYKVTKRISEIIKNNRTVKQEILI